MYFVRSWTLPKKKRGTYPAGYVSMQMNGPSHRAVAEGFARQHDKAIRAIEVSDAWSGKAKKFKSTFGLLIG